MHVSKLTLIAIVTFISHAAFAGWISGGGEIATDAHNPWFLKKSAPVVRYCIESDENAFGIALENSQKSIRRALNYWQEHFESANRIGWNRTFQVGTDQFQEVSCQVDHDLTFQLGVLTKTQIDYLKDPRAFVAVAIRTDYDLARMRAKGFIYVSPQAGPLAPVNANPKRWSLPNIAGEQNWLLTLALVHELGHVYGINHFGNELSLLGEQYLDTVADAGSGPELTYDVTIPRLIRPRNRHSEYVSCIDVLRGGKWGSDDVCTKIVLGQDSLVVFGGPTLDGPFHEIGTAKCAPGDQFVAENSFGQTELILPKEQTVFGDSGRYKYNINNIEDNQVQMRYESNDGTIKKEILVRYNKGSLSFVEAQAGRLSISKFWTSL